MSLVLFHWISGPFQTAKIPWMMPWDKPICLWDFVGNSCTSVVNSCQCMAKPIHYCKVKLKKIEKKKNSILS